MVNRLPFLVSIPHGGDKIPREIEDRVRLEKDDILQNSDPNTRLIYHFDNTVLATVETSIARAIIDLNRAPYDRPPANPDGVVKTITPDGTRIYMEGRFPGHSLVNRLLQLYYYPYHEQINNLLDTRPIALALDCHSMTPSTPVMYPDPGTPRPLICLSNRGDERGMARKKSELLTCPPEWIQALCESFDLEFGDEGEVTMNRPFLGGFIMRSHFRQKRIPWIQIEINRRLYEPDDNSGIGYHAIDEDRIRELRKRICSVLEDFWSRIEGARH